MNYEDMSDFEINKAVSAHVDFGDLIVTVNDSNETVYLCEKDGLWDMLPIGHFNPCNNPSDAWPIIVENGISIDFWGDSWGADIQLDGEVAFEHLDKNPLLAAMICFLKMKDAEK